MLGIHHGGFGSPHPWVFQKHAAAVHQAERDYFWALQAFATFLLCFICPSAILMIAGYPHTSLGWNSLQRIIDFRCLVTLSASYAAEVCVTVLGSFIHCRLENFIFYTGKEHPLLSDELSWTELGMCLVTHRLPSWVDGFSHPVALLQSNSDLQSLSTTNLEGLEAEISWNEWSTDTSEKGFRIIWCFVEGEHVHGTRHKLQFGLHWLSRISTKPGT